jgi:hypothetical protein
MLNMKNKSKNDARNYSKLLKKASRNRGLPQHKKTHLWRKKRDESLPKHMVIDGVTPLSSGTTMLVNRCTSWLPTSTSITTNSPPTKGLQSS